MVAIADTQQGTKIMFYPKIMDDQFALRSRSPQSQRCVSHNYRLHMDHKTANEIQSYSHVIWVSWGLETATTWLVVQRLVHTNIKENMKAPLYWFFEKGIHSDRSSWHQLCHTYPTPIHDMFVMFIWRHSSVLSSRMIYCDGSFALLIIWNNWYAFFDRTAVQGWYIMMTSSNGNIFRVTGHLCGNSPVTGEDMLQGGYVPSSTFITTLLYLIQCTPDTSWSLFRQ